MELSGLPKAFDLERNTRSLLYLQSEPLLSTNASSNPGHSLNNVDSVTSSAFDLERLNSAAVEGGGINGLIHPPDWLGTEFPAPQPGPSNTSSWAGIGSSRLESSSWESMRFRPTSDEREKSHSDWPATRIQDDDDRAAHPSAFEAVLPSAGFASEQLVASARENSISPVDQTLAVLHQQRLPVRVRGTFSQEQRETAKVMRKVGNCLRCRAFKLAVSVQNQIGFSRSHSET